jgi:hypothetical protein
MKNSAPPQVDLRCAQNPITRRLPGPGGLWRARALLILLALGETACTSLSSARIRQDDLDYIQYRHSFFPLRDELLLDALDFHASWTMEPTCTPFDMQLFEIEDTPEKKSQWLKEIRRQHEESKSYLKEAYVRSFRVFLAYDELLRDPRTAKWRNPATPPRAADGEEVRRNREKRLHYAQLENRIQEIELEYPKWAELGIPPPLAEHVQEMRRTLPERMAQLRKQAAEELTAPGDRSP